MIAHHRPRAQSPVLAPDGGGIRSLVDQVADEQEIIPGPRIQQRQQGAQFVDAAVHVADDKGSFFRHAFLFRGSGGSTMKKRAEWRRVNTGPLCACPGGFVRIHAPPMRS